MNEAHADSSAPGLAGPELQIESRRESWSRRRWLTLVTLVFAGQLGLIFSLGEKKFPPPRDVANVPQITLADSSSELVALDDPTLFALPHADDFAPAVWSRMPAASEPRFRWKEPALPPLLAVENLGAVFTRFMQTNQFAAPALGFKPEPELSEPALPLLPVFAETSTLQIEGELAQRRLLTPVVLPSLPYPDVIGPSKVQALVDPAGNVVNAVLLALENIVEAAGRPDVGDTNALRIVRSLRFAPAPRLTVGQLIFNWRTVAPPATNSPATGP